MKKLATITLFILVTNLTFGQGAVAVDDTAQIKPGEYVTVNVLENDYHPDGKTFRIQNAFDAYAFTDSTITYYADYNSFYNINGFVNLLYILIDEDNVIGPESSARVHLHVNNSQCRDYLDANNIRAGINAWGNQFWQSTLSFNIQQDPVLFEYPKGSGKNTMFNQSLWVGGMDGASLKLAAERYRQVGNDYWSGPLSVDGASLTIDTATVCAWNRVWKLNVAEINYHRLHWNDPGYNPIENIKTWPAHGNESLNQSKYLAPFVDLNGDSIYGPMSGDYPLIRGDQCIFFIYNDLCDHTESEGENIGLEIHGMAYEFISENTNPMANTVFLSYKIFNRSSEKLDNAYVGLFCDFDIGNAYDDFVGCDVSRGAYYGYNGDDYDDDRIIQGDTTLGYGYNPPAQGIVILGGPYLDPNEEDDPDGGCDESITGVGFGDGVVDNERYGMTKFIYFNNSAGIQGDPQTAEEYYDYMQAIWKDGTAMEYGGNGHISSGAYGPACNFMYPGLSDPCYWGTGGEEPYGPVDWTEEIAGNQPADRRGLSVMGPFTFEPNSVEKVDLAFVTARGTDGPLSSVTLLKEYIDYVKNAYYEDPDYFGYQWLGEKEHKIEKQSLNIYPNPASDKIFIEHQMEGKTVDVSVYDAYGRLISQVEYAANEKIKVPVSNLKQGIYILSIRDGDNVYTGKFLKK